MMNIYELMEQLYTKYAYLSAGGDDNSEWPFTPIRELFEAYYALCPPIEDWPEDAAWYTIDADGITHFSEMEPQEHHRAFWVVSSGKFEMGARRSLPIGIDWRLCKWPRPEVSE